MLVRKVLLSGEVHAFVGYHLVRSALLPQEQLLHVYDGVGFGVVLQLGQRVHAVRIRRKYRQNEGVRLLLLGHLLLVLLVRSQVIDARGIVVSLDLEESARVLVDRHMPCLLPQRMVELLVQRDAVGILVHVAK